MKHCHIKNPNLRQARTDYPGKGEEATIKKQNLVYRVKESRDSFGTEVQVPTNQIEGSQIITKLADSTMANVTANLLIIESSGKVTGQVDASDQLVFNEKNTQAISEQQLVEKEAASMLDKSLSEPILENNQRQDYNSNNLQQNLITNVPLITSNKFQILQEDLEETSIVEPDSLVEEAATVIDEKDS